MSQPQVPPVLELRAGPVRARELWTDLRAHADLLPLLARQHFIARFRAARLGIAWSVVQPLVRGAVLAVVFTRFVPIEAGVAYPAFVLAGTATWAFLSDGVIGGTTAISGAADLTGRVYFPRLLLPTMPAAAALPSYLITIGVVLLLAWIYDAGVGWTLIALPGVIVLSLVLVSTISSALAMLHVYFRDVGPLVTTGMGVLFYATPVIYPIDAAGDLRWVLEINPFTGAVAVFRWSVFGGQEPVGTAVWWTLGWCVALLIVDVRAYTRLERTCADRL